MAGRVSFLLSDLVEEGIVMNAWSDEQLSELGELLGSIRQVKVLQRACAGEMALISTFFGQRGYEVFGMFGYRSNKHWGFLPAGWVDVMRARYLNRYLAIIRSLYHPDGTRIYLDVPPVSEPEESFFSRLEVIGIPRMSKVSEAAARVQTHVDMTRIGCALKRYHLSEGMYPESLGDLAPDWIDSIPNEVATGLPFLYRLAADGSYRFWSRGLDRDDDLGNPVEKWNSDGDWIWGR